ncbi:hypothetical protein U8V72_14480 [Priestia filamentosa]|uniref:hypothetical protein n=1 Tax=Priestia filamentosa TaxID=1402861 RepID=UPI0005895495
MKKAFGALILSSLVVGLAGCGGSDNAVESGDSKIKLSKDATIIRSNGVRPLVQPTPVTYLEEGPAKIETKVKGSNDMKFSSDLFIHEAASKTGLAYTNGTGSYSKNSEVNISDAGYYDIDVFGGTGNETENSGDFDGKWEVTVTQKPQKDKEFDKTLHFSLLDQSVGGELKSKLSEEFYDSDYTEAIRGFKVKDESSISFLTQMEDDSVLSSEMKNGKWVSKEKETAEANGIDNFENEHPDAEFLKAITTSNGKAELHSIGSTYYIVFYDNSISPEKIKVPKEDIKEIFGSDAFWEEKTNSVYSIKYKETSSYEDSAEAYLQKYDLKKKAFIKNKKGNSLLTKIPFENMGSTVYFATGDDGNVYVVNTLDNDFNNYIFEVFAFDEDFKQLAKPTKLTGSYADKDKAVAVAAYKGRLDIWNIYDARILVNLDYNNPLNIGVNRYTLTLQ